MPEIKVTREISAPPDRVWSVLTDLDAAPQMISGIEAVERLDGGGEFRVGTRWQETRTMFGRQATEEMEVTALDEGRSYTVEADGHGAHYTSTITVEPAAAGSRVVMTFAGEPQGTVAKVLAATVGRLFQGATRKALAKDLDDVASAAEG